MVIAAVAFRCWLIRRYRRGFRRLIDRLMNGHDVDAVNEFTSNPAVIGSGSALVRVFPTLKVRCGRTVVKMFAQLGWGFAPVGDVVADRS